MSSHFSEKLTFIVMSACTVFSTSRKEKESEYKFHLKLSTKKADNQKCPLHAPNLLLVSYIKKNKKIKRRHFTLEVVNKFNPNFIVPQNRSELTVLNLERRYPSFSALLIQMIYRDSLKFMFRKMIHPTVLCSYVIRRSVGFSAAY